MGTPTAEGAGTFPVALEQYSLYAHASCVAGRGGWLFPLLVGLVSLGTEKAAPAGAVFRSPPPPEHRASDSELVMTGTGPGQAVAGFIADPTFFFDPVADPYPPSNPTTGFTPLNEPFGGIIHAEPPGGGAQHSLYCIDIRTATYAGIGYKLGAWNATNVPNVGYVARLLNEYYPNNPDEPAALTDVNQKAAAVQAAIWFFTDKYVVNTSDPLRPVVVQIVDHIKGEGPLTEAPPPTLIITPSSASVPAGKVSGPFTVTSSEGANAVVYRDQGTCSRAAWRPPFLSPTGRRWNPAKRSG